MGHSKSPYYTKKEPERREIYAIKCMKYEAKLSEKDKEMQEMKQKYEQELQSIRKETNQKFNQIMIMIQHNPQLAKVKPEALVKKKI